MEKKFPNANKIFIDGLKHLSFVRPEFYLMEQEMSGWSKKVFLKALLDAYSYYSVRLKLEKKNRIKIERLKSTINDDGSHSLETVDLTNEMLEELLQAVNLAYSWNAPAPKFDNYDILSFAERAFSFIKTEFEIQLGKRKAFSLFLQTTADAHDQYILYQYDIISYAPLFDFIAFKRAIRELLLNSINIDYLQRVLMPFKKVGSEIIEMYNNGLHPLEEPVDENIEYKGRSSYVVKTVSFNEKDFSMPIQLSSLPLSYDVRPSKRYFNRDFALYVYNVTNLIVGEVLVKESDNVPEVQGHTKSIYINERIIDKLHERLSPKFYDSKELYRALKGEQLLNKLQYKLKANSLCAIFNYLLEINLIDSTKADTIGWLVSTFKITEKREAKELELSTVIRYFQQRQVDPPNGLEGVTI